jgi:hypothetical protein
MYETVVYIEAVAVAVGGVYLSVPGGRRPVPGSNDVSGTAASQSRQERPNRVFTMEIESFEHVTTLPLLCFI